MDRLIPVLVPAWVLIVLAMWALVSIAETIINIWLVYLNNRLGYARATTTASIGCHDCAKWSAMYKADFCCTCGADLRKK